MSTFGLWEWASEICQSQHLNAERKRRRRTPKNLLLHDRYLWMRGEDVVLAHERALLANHGHEVRLWSVSNGWIIGVWRKIQTAWQVLYSVAAHGCSFRTNVNASAGERKPSVLRGRWFKRSATLGDRRM